MKNGKGKMSFTLKIVANVNNVKLISYCECYL